MADPQNKTEAVGGILSSLGCLVIGAVAIVFLAIVAWGLIRG